MALGVQKFFQNVNVSLFIISKTKIKMISITSGVLSCPCESAVWSSHVQQRDLQLPHQVLHQDPHERTVRLCVCVCV